MNLLGKLRPNGCVNTALGLTETEQGAFDMADSLNTDPVEIWKPIPGWEGLYSVSNLGRIRRDARIVEVPTRWGGVAKRGLTELIVKTRIFGGRYMQTDLIAEGRRQTTYVHRLVCLAFHGPPPSDDYVVAHGDGDGLNNVPDNLRWATHKQNTADMVDHGTKLIGDGHPSARICADDVREIRRRADWRLDETFAASLGIKKKTVQNIRLGFKWKHVA